PISSSTRSIASEVSPSAASSFLKSVGRSSVAGLPARLALDSPTISPSLLIGRRSRLGSVYFLGLSIADGLRPPGAGPTPACSAPIGHLMLGRSRATKRGCGKVDVRREEQRFGRKPGSSGRALHPLKGLAAILRLNASPV